MSTKKEKVSQFSIIMKYNNKSESYRVSEEVFNQIKNEIAPYRAISDQPKGIECVETGKIFANSVNAARWCIENNLATSYSCAVKIRNACNGKIESAYGYHWKYIKN